MEPEQNSLDVVYGALLSDLDSAPWQIRQLMASNPDSPSELLEYLAEDTNLWVRWAVVQNPSCPQEALLALIDDADVGIGAHAASVVMGSPLLFQRVAEDHSVLMWCALYSNRLCPPDIRDSLAKAINVACGTTVIGAGE